MTTVTVIPLYEPDPPLSPREEEDNQVHDALSILNRRLFQRDGALPQPSDVRRYLQLRMMPLQRETFAVLFLDAGHRVIAFEVLSEGSLTYAYVYPRVVLERALVHNAAAIVLVHNNPSGRIQPSDADIRSTASVKTALGIVDIRVLDHFIIGAEEPYSFAEHGLI